MPPPPNPNPNAIPPIRRENLTVLQDLDGREILRIGLHETTIKQPGINGALEVYKTHDNIRLVDGSMWNAMMLMEKPPVNLAVCAICRHPPWKLFGQEQPTHGLLRLNNAKTCPCGHLVCRAHRKRCDDGVWRCLPCARRWQWGQRILGVFFSKE